MATPLHVRYPEFRGGVRPYLALHLTGLNGHSGNVVGLVDSGADTTCLPMPMAALLGYESEDLEPNHIRQAAGTIDALRALRPSRARLLGAPDLEFDIQPVFIHDGAAVWGRTDFFRAFDAVTFRDTETTLVLHPR